MEISIIVIFNIGLLFHIFEIMDPYHSQFSCIFDFIVHSSNAIIPIDYGDQSHLFSKSF